MARPNYNYWGKPQHTTRIARGVLSITTERHGGFTITDRVWQSMPRKYQTLAAYAGYGTHENCFEEDENWAILVCALPDLPWDRVFANVESTKALARKITGRIITRVWSERKAQLADLPNLDC